MKFVVHNLTKLLEEKRSEITQWMATKRSEVPIPIYGSVDIRDSGWKVAVVDANHFPAGFNNVSKEDESNLSSLLRDHILRLNQNCKWVHLYPESHTRNQGYVENVSTIKRLITMGGFRCTVGSPELEGHGSLDGISGPLLLNEVILDGDSLLVEGEQPDLIMLNNDLTEGLLPGLSSNQVFPPPHMGWQRRRKSEHYACLQSYVDEIADILGIDREPVAFIKNDRGTYGLGIMAVSSGDQLLNLSNRKFKRLMYSKGGVDVENFLIQEGVPTLMKSTDGSPVEPVVYLVDGEAASWFYRINSKKGEMENLNSPSARFLPYSEVGDKFGEHAHGWHALIAELSMLAMGAESKKQLEGSM